jgi:stage V sporulation protein D (sporulation-specific penicillin-binding protein)
VRQVISESTSQTVRQILEQVVGDQNEGTGRNAAVTGYRIGGKTGTSEKVSLEAQTGQKEYIVSFIGFAPADDPQIAILVFLDTPSDKSGIYISGGQMAAPVVGNMFSDILPYMGIEPEKSDGTADDVTVPMLVNSTLSQAAESLKASSLSYRTIGQGDTVTDQLPVAGTSIASDSQIILYLGGTEISLNTETVPELTGMSYSEARDKLSSLGLFISTRSVVDQNSSQIISSQSISAGTAADHGCIVEVTLIDDNEALLGKY